MDSRKVRHYSSTNLPSIKSGLQNSFKEDKIESLWKLYTHVCQSWQKLVDIRFKLLSFTPVAAVLSIKQIFDLNNYFLKCILTFLGFIVTLGIFIYEKRNTELHNDLISRGRKIEEELGFANGQFLGRLDSANKFLYIKVQHDVALKMIYYSSIFSWLVFLFYNLFLFFTS